jgi:hypothetical protein
MHPLPGPRAAALLVGLLASLAPLSEAQGTPERYYSATCEADVIYATGETVEFGTLVTARDLASGNLLWTKTLEPEGKDGREGRAIAFVAPDSVALVEREAQFVIPGLVDHFTNVVSLDAADGSMQWLDSYFGRATDIAISGPAAKAAFVLAQGDFYVDFEALAVDLQAPSVSYPSHGVFGDQSDLDTHQFAFSPDGAHLYQSFSYESFGSSFAIAGDGLAHWDFQAGTLQTVDLPGSTQIPGIGGIGQGRGLGVSPDGQRLYLAGGGPTTHQWVLDAFDLTQLDALANVRLGTSTCLAVTDAGPLYLGWRFGGFFEPSYADADFFVWIEDGAELSQSTQKLNDPCGQNLENLHPAGSDTLFLRRANAGCSLFQTVEKRRIADGALLWSHAVQPEVSGSFTISQMAWDAHTDSLVLVGRGQGQALTYAIDAQDGSYLATYLD